MRTSFSALVLTSTLALAACGGGGGGSSVTPSTGGGNNGGGLTQTQQSEQAITVANSVGDPVKTMTNFNSGTTGAQAVQISNGAQVVVKQASGTCNNGVEFWSPDKNNDANSTEDQFFYDSACTELARDIVRIYSINGSSETINRTEKQYAINNATATAQRTDSVVIQNGTYDKNGFPIVADGFARAQTGELDISGAKTIVGDDELVMSASTTNVNNFCGDSAGYNATGIASLNETFGWQGATASGTRTVNSDGSVTWASTHAGSSFKGAIGSLAVNAGTQNTACPITTPEFTLTGGTNNGSYSIPVSTTFTHGLLTNLTVTNATLANGNTLNVTTNTGVSPQNSQFITGVVSNGSTQIATFAVDAFGDGTVTVTSSGAQYVMSDWHVVK